jgi:hypothetical protein
MAFETVDWEFGAERDRLLREALNKSRYATSKISKPLDPKPLTPNPPPLHSGRR